MSLTHGKLVSLILKENFGTIVEKIGSYLYKWGPSPLAFISKTTEIPIETVKRCLCFLIKLGFVTFEQGRTPTCANYSLISDKVLLRLRYCRYVEIIKKKFGCDAEIIFEEILQQGILRASEAILRAAKHKETQEELVDLASLRDGFLMLVSNQYLMRLPSPVEEKHVPVLQINERDLFLIPDIDIRQLHEMYQNPDVNIVPVDNIIYWRINFDRCHQDMRDAFLISAMQRRIDDNGAELMRMLLKSMYIRTEPWVKVSNPIPSIELKDILKKQNDHSMLVQYLGQYLNMIEDDPAKFIQKVGDAAGGQYIINMKEAFTQLTWAAVENIIVEKFGSNAARIFRLVRAKKYIEADHIQQLAMIPNKDAKRITYQLLEENYLQMRELRKTQASAGPMKTFILFFINFDQVVRMLLDTTYKSIYNIQVRRQHFTAINKPIIDKKQRADAIELELQSKVPPGELEEILGELITPSEREVLEKIGRTNRKLNSAVIHLDETVFLFQLYLEYNTK